MDEQITDSHQKEQPINAVKDTVEKPVSADSYGLNIPAIYANDTNIIVNPSDISIVFSYNVNGFTSVGSQPLVRVILSHDSFIKMMDFWATRSQFLERIYAKSPISLLDFIKSNPDEFNDLWRRMIDGINEESDK